MKRRNSRKNWIIGIGCANLATFVWATNMVFGRLLKDSAGPITISAIRFLIASIIFAILLRRQPPKERRMGKDRWFLIGMAIAGVVLFSPVLYLGLRYTTAVNSALINALTPLITGFFAAWLIKEPMSKWQICGAIVACIGVSFLVSGGSLFFWQTAHFNIGDFIILISVAIWGTYSIMGSQVMGHRSSISTTALSTFIGVPILCLLALWELRSFPINLDVKVICILLYIGIVPCAIGFYAWNAAIAHIGPNNASVFYNTIPLYGALLGFIFLGEPIGVSHIIGGSLIIGGGILATRKKAAVTQK